MANKVVQHLVLDSEIVRDLKRLSAVRNESMSLVVREILRPALANYKIGASN